MSTLKPSKSVVWRPKIFFVKIYLKMYVSLMLSSDIHISDPKLTFLITILDDSAWFCLEKLKNIFLQQKTLTFNKHSKNKIRINT